MSRLVLLLISVTLALELVNAQSDLVTNLPGYQGPLAEKQFAGHITVNETFGGNLFYWFFEHVHGLNVNTSVILWLNGGPGMNTK